MQSFIFFVVWCNLIFFCLETDFAYCVGCLKLNMTFSVFGNAWKRVMRTGTGTGKFSFCVICYCPALCWNSSIFSYILPFFFLKKCQIPSFKSKKQYLLIYLCVKSVLPNNVQYIYVCTTWSQHYTWKWIHMTAEVNSHILNNRSSQSFSEDWMNCSSAFPAALPYFSFLNIGIPRAHAWSISSTSHPVHSEGCVLVPYICQVQFIKSLAL